MPTFKEAKEDIACLAEKLDWGNSRKDVSTKLWYAVIEAAEAGNVWKHRKDPKWLLEEYNIKTKEDLDKYMHEELIDVMFYVLHGIHCLNPDLDPDAEFIRKLNINAQRKRHYIDDNTESKEMK